MAKKTTAKKEAELKELEELATRHRQEEADIAVEKRLVALYSLQKIDSQLNKIHIIRGELPLEVQDLEDDIAGLETRINNFTEDVAALQAGIVEKENMIVDSKKLIKKYETQQNNVRNNREFDSLSKEIEFQNLEIQLSERKIKDAKMQLDVRNQEIEKANANLEERKKDLSHKRDELEEITKETAKEESDLAKRSEEQEKLIEDRYLAAYKRIRKNARNGLAVVAIERDACGGCFNKIPYQRQVEIRMHKKLLVCEHCGRILIDQNIIDEAE